MSIAARLSYPLNLRRGAQKVILPAFVVGDTLAHEIVLQCAEAAHEELNGVGVSATFIRADGKTTNITGTVVQEGVSVLLPQFCYAVPGHCMLTINLVQGMQRATVLYACGAVLNNACNEAEKPTTSETALLGMAILGKMRLNCS